MICIKITRARSSENGHRNTSMSIFEQQQQKTNATIFRNVCILLVNDANFS